MNFALLIFFFPATITFFLHLFFISSSIVSFFVTPPFRSLLISFSSSILFICLSNLIFINSSSLLTSTSPLPSLYTLPSPPFFLTYLGISQLPNLSFSAYHLVITSYQHVTPLPLSPPPSTSLSTSLTHYASNYVID